MRAPVTRAECIAIAIINQVPQCVDDTSYGFSITLRLTVTVTVTITLPLALCDWLTMYILNRHGFQSFFT